MKVKVKSLSCVRLFASPWTLAYETPPSMEFSRQENWSGCHFLFQGIFLTQGSNLDLPHCRQMLNFLSHQGSPSEMCIYIYTYIYIFFFSNHGREDNNCVEISKNPYKDKQQVNIAIHWIQIFLGHQLQFHF